MRDFPVRAAPLAVSLLIGLCCSSCHRGKPFYPVRGQVFADGKPAEGVMIILHSQDETDPMPVQPSAVVEADGSFALKSFLVEDQTMRDGAPAGQYRVTCTWYPADLDKYSGSVVIPDRLQGKYGNAKTTPLVAEVRAEPTELPPFQLNTGKE